MGASILDQIHLASRYRMIVVLHKLRREVGNL